MFSTKNILSVGLNFKIIFIYEYKQNKCLLSDNGTEIMTPFPVPIHSRVQEINMAVILTKENPSLPVPENRNNNQN